MSNGRTGVSWQFPIECAFCKIVFPNSKALAMHLAYEHRVLEEDGYKVNHK